jgi:hypothetical protein
MARRAIREGATAKQKGVSTGLLWAVPMKSPRGIEAVVAAVGELGDLPRVFAHGGLALARERFRQEEERGRGEAESRARNLDSAVEILDRIVRRGGTDDVLRLVAAAASRVPGLGMTAIWALRPEDEMYVEVARAGGGPTPDGSELAPPAAARRAGALCDWANGLPRWGGVAWIPPAAGSGRRALRGARRAGRAPAARVRDRRGEGVRARGGVRRRLRALGLARAARAGEPLGRGEKPPELRAAP